MNTGVVKGGRGRKGRWNTGDHRAGDRSTPREEKVNHLTRGRWILNRD